MTDEKILNIQQMIKICYGIFEFTEIMGAFQQGYSLTCLLNISKQ